MPSAQPCDIGLVFALAAEQGCTEDLLGDLKFIEADGLPVRLGDLHGRAIAIATSGPGRDAAALACRKLIDGHRPQWLISAGFCGGLAPELRRNDVVAATSYVDAPQLAEPLTRDFERAAAAGMPPPKLQGPCVSVDRIIAKSVDKQVLRGKTQALACDMESAAVAGVCAERRLPCLVLRVVSDPVDEDLPPDLEPLMQPQSTARLLGSVVGALWRRPASAKDLWRLKEHALVASDTLAKHLSQVIAALPVTPRIREAPEKPQLGDEGSAS